MHSKITRHERQNVSIYISIYVHVYLLYISIYPSIHINLSMSVSVILEITKLYSITVCELRVLLEIFGFTIKMQ